MNCLDPGPCYSDLSACVCGGERGGHPKPDSAPPQLLQGTVSRDSAAMEGTCDWMTPTHSGRVAAESGIQQNKGTIVCASVGLGNVKRTTSPLFFC